MFRQFSSINPYTQMVYRCFMICDGWNYANVSFTNYTWQARLLSNLFHFWSNEIDSSLFSDNVFFQLSELKPFLPQMRPSSLLKVLRSARRAEDCDATLDQQVSRQSFKGWELLDHYFFNIQEWYSGTT